MLKLDFGELKSWFSTNYHLVATADNDLTSSDGYTTLIDTIADGTAFLTKPYIYTTGGILPDQSFPAANIAKTHQNRLWFSIDGLNDRIGYTKLGLPSTTPAWNSNYM